MGQCDGGIHLVESVADVERLAVADPDNLAYVTQTTLSVDDAAAIVDALKQRFPGHRRPEEGRHLLCDAEPAGRGQVHGAAGRCRDRRRAARTAPIRTACAKSPRMRGIPAYMVDRADELDARWIAGKTRVGVTAGASAPEVLVREVLARLESLGASSVRELHGAPENVVFPMPKGLPPAHASAAEG